MSLVVARVVDNYIYIVSDTKLTLSNNHTLTAVNHLTNNFELKVYIVDEKRCIAYAGNSECAHDAINSTTQVMSDREILAVLRNSCCEEHCNVEYLFCSLEQSPTIEKITSDQHPNNTGLAVQWIGSAQGFRLFQGYMNNQVPPVTGQVPYFTFRISPVESPDNNESPVRNVMLNAMERLIADGGEPSIGGIRISVSTDSTGFKYDSYNTTTTIPEFILRREPFSGGCPYGDGGQNAFTVCVASVDREQLAIHVPSARLGISYQKGVTNLLSKEVYQGLMSREFWEAIKNRVGSVQVAMTSDSAKELYTLAWFELQTNKFKEAVDTFDVGIAISSKFWGGYPVPPGYDPSFKSLDYHINNSSRELAIPHQNRNYLAQAFFHRGYANLRLGNLGEADRDFTDSIKVDASFRPTLIIKALLNKQFQKLNPALSMRDIMKFTYWAEN